MTRRYRIICGKSRADVLQQAGNGWVLRPNTSISQFSTLDSSDDGQFGDAGYVLFEGGGFYGIFTPA